VPQAIFFMLWESGSFIRPIKFINVLCPFSEFYFKENVIKGFFLSAIIIIIILSIYEQKIETYSFSI
jgi:hypothetical protein